MLGALRSGGDRIGGALGYPLKRLYEEVAYVAYHFHWPHEQLMSLEHLERRQWVQQIAELNRRANESGADAESMR